MAPPAPSEPGASLGSSSTPAEAAALQRLLDRLSGRTLLMVGDSSLRNQWVQLAREGLRVPRELPLAFAATHGNYSGSFTPSHPIRQHDRLDSSHGFWGGFQA